MVNNSDITVFSFDVFDTVLTRIVADPKDIFLLMQSKLKGLDINLPDKLIENFAQIRVNSERAARRATEREDIKIEDIYTQISKKYGLSDKQTAGLIQKELEIECRSVCPICWTISEINSLRKQGARIVFVSDMYLPEQRIRDMLIRVGAYQEGDKLYASGEIGLAKSSGNLFRHILKKENCDPHRMAHCGNNIHGDIFIPARMGIHIYKTSEEELQKLLRYHKIDRLKNFVRKAIIRLWALFLNIDRN